MPAHTVNGITLSYTERGNGPSLVLIHGFPLNSSMWEAQIEHFSARFRVIAPDLRGFGNSSSGEPFTIAALADDIRALLLKLDALPCTFCGFSMGGYVALAYRRKCPADLRALVLMDTRAEADTTEGKTNRNKMIELVRTSGSKAVAEQMLPKLLSDQTRQSQPSIVQNVRNMIEKCPPLTIEHALAAMRDRDDQTERLGSIAAPTLILVGEHDVLTPPDMSRAMHARIPRSKLAIIPNAGHMAPTENPSATNAELEQFLDEVK